MIKKALVLTMFFAGSAHANCANMGEAQVRGTVVSISKSLSGCRAFLGDRNLKVQSNHFCPLNEDKLQREGIEVGLVSGHDCAAEVGQEINAILVDNGAAITLEK